MWLFPQCEYNRLVPFQIWIYFIIQGSLPVKAGSPHPYKAFPKRRTTSSYQLPPAPADPHLHLIVKWEKCRKHPTPISLSSYFFSTAWQAGISAICNDSLLNAPVPQNTHLTHWPKAGRGKVMEGRWGTQSLKWELWERFCFVGGNTSMGGSCINREEEHLDVYRRGWQVLSLDEALSPAEGEFLERFSMSVHSLFVSLFQCFLSFVFLQR